MTAAAFRSCRIASSTTGRCGSVQSGSRTRSPAALSFRACGLVAVAARRWVAVVCGIVLVDLGSGGCDCVPLGAEGVDCLAIRLAGPCVLDEAVERVVV